MLEEFIQQLQNDSQFSPAIAALRVLDPIPASFANLEMRKDLRQALTRLGIDQLYEHQTRTIEESRRGKNVVVSTPTASGKTLCFNIPVVEAILDAKARGEQARALYLFPLKALEQDQLKSLRKLQNALSLYEPFEAAIFDGDTKKADRKRLRQQPPHVLITNPDMLHASILPGHESWKQFFSQLRYIVLDELHTYRGVFGSHVLHILRRLRRVAEIHGAQPQIIAASATIRNPRELAEELFGLPFELIEKTGSPQGPRSVLLLDPPNNGLTFAVGLFSGLVKRGIKTIAFCKSRRATELLYGWALERSPELRGKISAYRSGYLPGERRQIEAELFGGHLKGVVSTSALEMGIDVGGLDAAVLVGYPGSIMSTWQRAGRAGRGQKPAALFVIMGHDALDQYYVGSPGAFFRAPPEAAVVDATNVTIRNAHLLCAGAEVPLRETEKVYKDLNWRTARQELQQRGLLLQSVAGDAWYPVMPRPHREVDIRQIGETYTIHINNQERTLLGTIGGSRAFAECHEGGIYLHRGQHFEVSRLDLERRRVFVERTNGSVFTVARSAKQTQILEVQDTRTLASTQIHLGRLRITQRITGYEKRAGSDQRLLGTFDLELPPTIYETQGFWIEVDPGTKALLQAADCHPMGSLHAIEHAMIALSPLFTLCDASDIGGITFTEHPEVPGGAIFIYDSYPGGIGLSARAYRILPRVLKTVFEVIDNCDCENGCPRCIHSPRCGAGNYPLDKNGSRLALRSFLNLLEPGEKPCSPLPFASFTSRSSEHSAEPSLRTTETGAKLEIALAPQKTTTSEPLPKLANGETPDVIYFDLETLRSAKDVGGWHRIDDMGLALGVVYSEREDKFKTYFERQAQELVEDLSKADLVVGYNLIRFDYKVLSAYTSASFKHTPTFDMFLKLFELLGTRLSLATLATATLGTGKSANGLQSLEWVRQGRLDLVEDYCRQDVVVTRDLFRYAIHHGHLAFDRKGVDLRTPPLGWEIEYILRDASLQSAARMRGASDATRVPAVNPVRSTRSTPAR